MGDLPGHVDRIDLTSVDGWARPTTASNSDSVVIRVNEHEFEVRADRPRADLTEAGLGPCHFHLDIPADVRSLREVEIEVKLKSTGRTLPGGFCVYREGKPSGEALRDWAEQNLFADAYAWMKDSSLDELNYRIHDRGGTEGDAALRARARDFVEFFRVERRVVEVLRSAKPPREILDFGPGVGWPMQYVVETFGARVTGIDVSQNMLARLKVRIANEMAPECRSLVRVLQYDGKRFPVEDASFDLAMAFACLHHIPEEWLYVYFQEFHRALREGALLIGQILNSSGSYRVRAEIEAEFARRRRRDYETHPHFYHSRDAVEALLEHAGFRDVAFLDGNESVFGYVGFVARKGH